MSENYYICDHMKKDFFNNPIIKCDDLYEVKASLAPENKKCPICGNILTLKLKNLGFNINDSEAERKINLNNTSAKKQPQSISGSIAIINNNNSSAKTKENVSANSNISESKKNSINSTNVSGNSNNNLPIDKKTQRNNVPTKCAKHYEHNGISETVIGQKSNLKMLESLKAVGDLRELSESKAEYCGSLDTYSAFIVSGAELQGKTTFINEIEKNLKAKGIHSSKPVCNVELSKFNDAYHNGVTDLNSSKTIKGVEGIKLLLSKNDDVIVKFDASFDELFKNSQGIIKPDVNPMLKELIIIFKFYSKKITFLIECSDIVADAIRASDSKMKDYVFFFVMEEYSTDEAVLIADRIAGKFGKSLDDGAKRYLKNNIKDCKFSSDNSMGRFLLEKVKMAEMKQSIRLKTSDGNMNVLMKEDFAKRKIDYDLLKKAREKLNQMRGIDAIKKQLEKYINIQKDNEEREAAGLPENRMEFMNILLLGNPGTGKTTVVDLIADILYALGLISVKKVKSMSVGDLESPYVGDASTKVKKAYEEARGGILFIDEAYSLCSSDASGGSNGSGHGEAIINELTDCTTRYKNEVFTIMAGYEEPMSKLLRSNEGLSSRFPYKIKFEDYSKEVLFEILLSKLKECKIDYEVGCEQSLKKLLSQEMSKSDFKNARGVMILIDKLNEVIAERNCRLRSEGNSSIQTLLISDVEQLITDKGDGSLAGMLSNLETMIGMEEAYNFVKGTIEATIGKEMVKSKYGIEIGENRSLNMIITGPTGSGKTSLAVMIAKIYGAAGILKNSDRIIKVNGRDLIGKFVGHSEDKIAEKINRAKGGTLIIDEAYTLVNSSSSDYGHQVIQYLLDKIDGMGQRLMVILTGYEEEMTEFLAENEGIEGRFPNKIALKEYSTSELVEIFVRKLEEQTKLEVPQCMMKEIEACIIRKKEEMLYFSNARTVEDIVTKVVNKICIRMNDPSESYELKAEDLDIA